MSDADTADTSPESGKIVTRLCPIEVPKVVLTADDCDPSLPVPEPCSWEEAVMLPASKRRFNFQLPAESKPGSVLTFNLEGSEKVAIKIPEGVEGGDQAVAMQRADGRWRIARQPMQHTLVVPADATPGQVLKPQLPDATVLNLELPENAHPGHLIELQNLKTGWAVIRLVDLVQVAFNPLQSETLRGPYLEALECLRRSGALSSLKADADGMLIVNVPFCGRFQEYAMLGHFLAEHCLSLPGVRGAKIFATDTSDKYHFEWAVAKRWFSEFYPTIEVHILVRDLHIDPLPRAALTIASHPEVTRGGAWFPIIGSVVGAAKGGTCLIGTFFEDEAATLHNMVQMYKDDGVSCEQSENPHFETPEGKCRESKRMRYLLQLSAAPPPAEPAISQEALNVSRESKQPKPQSVIQTLGQMMASCCSPWTEPRWWPSKVLA